VEVEGIEATHREGLDAKFLAGDLGIQVDRHSGLRFLEQHAHVMQSWDERRAVDLLRAAGSVAEPDDVSAVLFQPSCEREAFGVEGEGDEPGFAVGVVTHQDRQLTAGLEGLGSVPQELTIPTQEVVECRRPAQLIRSLDEGEFRDKLLRAKVSLGLDYPHVVELRFAERSFDWLLADAREGAVARGDHEALQRLHEELQRLQEKLNQEVPAPAPANAQLMLEALANARVERPGTLAYQQAMEVAARRFQEYRTEFLGGTAMASFKSIANPASEDVRDWVSRAAENQSAVGP
jgi:hypothetical protein